MVSGLALFSDGYNAQIIGYMNPLFSELYKDAGFGSTIKTRLSNSYLIGEIFGMLFFGFLIDRIGRRTGIVFATLFLVLGVIIATAAHGTTPLGMFWMMIIGRGIAGFGAGGGNCLFDRAILVAQLILFKNIQHVLLVPQKPRTKTNMSAADVVSWLQWRLISPSISDL
ncbi:hypothetical protein LTR97_006780 [Elasticomyces elasticus]|uniref:Major facilitator superfamily (MFS) profile domain-containing protein n=1 Tax=Elasticomyces elasticus TaxID=574655 RepID=A0AAN7ZTV8_9PEZI|nr:hypothetical protein LTR97_006780 [Elasticomyces elasticus]